MQPGMTEEMYQEFQQPQPQQAQQPLQEEQPQPQGGVDEAREMLGMNEYDEKMSAMQQEMDNMKSATLQ